VLHNGEDLTILTDKEKTYYRKENISFIFQSFNLIPVLTVRENVELPLIIEKKFTKSEIYDKVTNIIEIVGLEDMADRFPRELSGGQEQRVAIARALVKKSSWSFSLTSQLQISIPKCLKILFQLCKK